MIPPWCHTQPVVETTKIGEETHTEEPHLTATEESRQYEGRVNLSSGGLLGGVSKGG